jgi:hypothetical protein
MQTCRPGVLAALVLVGSGAAGASGQYCVSFGYLDVPDFDQIRGQLCYYTTGLPDNGRGHCYPTSLTNWLCFLANHGFPELASVAGPMNWESPAPDVYNHVTSVIEELGGYMGTTANGTPSTWIPGWHQYVAAHAPYEGFYLATFGMSPGTYGQNLFDGVPNMMRAGGVFELGIKWMDLHGETNTYWARGAHLVSLAVVEDPCGIFPRLQLRDPAHGGGGECEQSNFSSFYSYVSYLTADFDLDRDGPGAPVTLGRYRLDGWHGVRYAFVWGLRAFSPPIVVARGVPDGRSLRFIRPRWWDVDPRPPVEDVALPSSAPILQVALAPDFANVLYTTASVPGGVPIPARLVRYRIGDGAFQTLTSFTSNPGPIAFDRFGELFVLTTNVEGTRSLRRYEVTNGMVVERASRIVSVVPEALIYDDVTDELVGVSAASDRLVRWPRALTSESSWALPGAASDLLGTASITISPIDSRVWVMGSGADRAFELIQNAGSLGLGGRATLPGGLGVVSLSMDPGGRLYAASTAQLEVYREAAPGQQTWEHVIASPFNDMSIGGSFAMPRDRDTYVGAERGYMESDPEHKFPCPVDYSGDGLDNSQDFFDYLVLFFGGSMAADYNHDGAVNSQDFFDFLAGFFEGC